ncbi:MAG: hypothetical protein AAF441_22545 [Pseudomonadota bacterium]
MQNDDRPRKGRADRDPPTQEDEETARRRRFAEGIARAEFGRHYWDARKEEGPKKPRRNRE